MDFIDRLPNEIVFQILSHVDSGELLNLGKVCTKLNSLVNEFVCKRVTSIDEKIIDYPYGSFLENFIALCHRVENVQQVFTGLSPLYTSGDGNPELQEAMRDALLEMAKKLKAGVAFPLVFVQDILTLEHVIESANGYVRVDELLSISEAHKEVARVMQQLGIDELEAVKVKQLSLFKHDVGCGPFSVTYKGRALSVVYGLSRITHLHIERLLALTTSLDDSKVIAFRNVLGWLSCFPRLETVRLEQVEFFEIFELDVMGDATIRIKFHLNGIQFSVDEFLSFLELLGEKSDLRTMKIVTRVEEWEKSGLIERYELTLDAEQDRGHVDAVGERREYDLDYGDDDEDITSLLLNHHFSSPLTSKVHLILYQYDEGKEDENKLLLGRLEDYNVLAQLKDFTMSFGKRICEACDSEESWDEAVAVHVMAMVVDFLAKNMNNLEILRLECNSCGRYCYRSELKSTIVFPALPLLQDVCIEGLLPWPFIVSIVEKTANLRRLIISNNYEDGHTVMEWINKLLDALQNKTNLCIFVLHVEHTELPDIEVQRIVGNDNGDGDNELVTTIKKQAHRLVSILPTLHYVLITLTICDLYYELSRFGAVDRAVLLEEND